MHAPANPTQDSADSLGQDRFSCRNNKVSQPKLTQGRGKHIIQLQIFFSPGSVLSQLSGANFPHIQNLKLFFIAAVLY